MSSFNIAEFFRIHALSGGKRIQILVGQELHILTLNQLTKLPCSFELSETGKRYIIKNDLVTQL